MPWISVEGAGLLAQIVPVGILIIVVEARATAKLPRVRGRFGIYSRASAWVTGISALFGVTVVSICWTAVNNQKAVHGFSAWVVLICGTLLAVSVSAVLLDLIELLGKAEKAGIDAVTHPAVVSPKKSSKRSSRRRGRK